MPRILLKAVLCVVLEYRTREQKKQQQQSTQLLWIIIRKYEQ